MAVSEKLTVLERGEPGYEEARLESVWNGRKPDRYPAAIARVHDAEQVVEAVQLAIRRDLRVTVRSGGHGWSASHLRDGALLIDMSRLTGIEVDPRSETAWVAPGVKGEQLLRELRDHDLFFTTGHCNDVGLGGFTLGGGFGWMSRAHGFACTSVLALDVVTATGELVRADPTQNTDLYWAARGSGHGFFGVVTRFQYQVYPLYPVTMASTDVYPREALDDVFLWVESIASDIPDALELRVNLGLEHPGVDGVGLRVVGSTFAGSHEEARDNLAVLDTCPALPRAVSSVRNFETDVLDLVMASDAACKPGKRQLADNMWSGATMSELLPGLRRIADTMTHESFMMWHLIGADPTPAGDMFHSLHDRYNGALYAVWEDPADDAELEGWLAQSLREMEPLSTGIQLNDENLQNRSRPFASGEAMRRIEQIRAARDPESRFHTWMGADLDA